MSFVFRSGASFCGRERLFLNPLDKKVVRLCSTEQFRKRASVAALPWYCCCRSLCFSSTLVGKKYAFELNRKQPLLVLCFPLCRHAAAAQPVDAIGSSLDGVGGRKIRNVAHGAHARGLRRQITGIGSLPAELRCLYPEVRTRSAALEHHWTNT